MEQPNFADRYTERLTVAPNSTGIATKDEQR